MLCVSFVDERFSKLICFTQLDVHTFGVICRHFHARADEQICRHCRLHTYQSVTNACQSMSEGLGVFYLLECGVRLFFDVCEYLYAQKTFEMFASIVMQKQKMQ